MRKIWVMALVVIIVAAFAACRQYAGNSTDETRVQPLEIEEIQEPDEMIYQPSIHVPAEEIPLPEPEQPAEPIPQAPQAHSIAGEAQPDALSATQNEVVGEHLPDEPQVVSEATPPTEFPEGGDMWEAMFELGVTDEYGNHLAATSEAFAMDRESLEILYELGYIERPYWLN